MWRNLVLAAILLFATPAPLAAQAARSVESPAANCYAAAPASEVVVATGKIWRNFQTDGSFQVRETAILTNPVRKTYAALSTFVAKNQDKAVELTIRTKPEDPGSRGEGFLVSGLLTFVSKTSLMIELAEEPLTFLSLMIADHCTIGALRQFDDKQVEVKIRVLIRTYTL